MKRRCNEIGSVLIRDYTYMDCKQQFGKKCFIGLLLFILFPSSLSLYAQDDQEKTFYDGNQKSGHIELIDTWWGDSLTHGIKRGYSIYIAMSAQNLKNQEVKIVITMHSVLDKFNFKKILWESKMLIKNDDIVFPIIKTFVPIEEILKIGAPLVTYYAEVYDKNGILLAKRRNTVNEDMHDKPEVDLRIVYLDNKPARQNDVQGIKIHTNMYIHRMKGSDIQLCVSFFQKDGKTPLRDSKGNIITLTGTHTVTNDFEHDSDIWIFIPYYIIYSSDVEKEDVNDGKKYEFLIRFVLKNKDGHALSGEKEFRINAEAK